MYSLDKNIELFSRLLFKDLLISSIDGVEEMYRVVNQFREYSQRFKTEQEAKQFIRNLPLWDLFDGEWLTYEIVEIICE